MEVAFTDRLGGLSTGPYAELNLKPYGEADADRVPANVERVRQALAGGGPAPGWVEMDQVHSATVAVVGGRVPEPAPTADALVTAVPGTVLVTRAADCVPLVLADPGRGLVGAVHAGRNGVLLGVVPAAVAALRDLGAEDLVAWVGPSICGRCYEVPADLRDEVAAQVPATRSETSWGTPALDLPAGVRAQLGAERVEVVEVARCTYEDPELYSYRRQGPESGRHAGLVWVRP